MVGWRSDRTLGLPLLWVLHLGHAWLPIGFALAAAADLGVAGVTPDAAIHALTAGAIGTTILAVMTRAALGHTGRPLVPAPAIVFAYYLLAGAALARVFGPLAAPDHYVEWIAASGLVWAAAFAVFAAVYMPILTRPRADGRPG
jgi:uncharacterized protein involved in response to NO